MVKVKDLKDQIGEPGPYPILFCPLCDCENSANAGDYFAANPETVFECCEEPMLLVVKETHYIEV